MSVTCIYNTSNFNTITVLISGLSGLSVNQIYYSVGYFNTFIVLYENTEVITSSSDTHQLIINDLPLTPDTDYIIDINLYSSEEGLVGSDSGTVTTNSVDEPSGTISPLYFPQVKAQDLSGSCVAQCLTSAMEFFRLRGLQNQNYSEVEYYGASYLYGTDSSSKEEMSFTGALYSAKEYGTPRWEFVGTDKTNAVQLSKSDAQTVFGARHNISVINANARQNAISSYQKISSFYNTSAMKNALIQYGCLMFNFNMSDNFNSRDITDSYNGIMQTPDSWNGEGHCMLIIGLDEINGKHYWVAQNSWGSGSGRVYNPTGTNPNYRGYVYIPCDWGVGASPPDNSSGTNARAWVLSVYGLSANSYVSDAMPSTPSISTITRSGSTARVSWTGISYVLPYIYYNYEYVPTSPTGYNSYGSILASSPSTIYLPDASKGCQLGLIGYNQNTYRLSAWSNLEIIRGARPANWVWVSTVSQGVQVPTTDNGDGTYNAAFLTASEWNDFINRIKDFMEYLGVSYSIPDNYKATAGTQMTQSQVNGIRSAVNYISSRYGTIPAPDNVRRGNTITAAFFNGLKDSLNSIP